jgi:hypothetical protein
VDRVSPWPAQSARGRRSRFDSAHACELQAAPARSASTRGFISANHSGDVRRKSDRKEFRLGLSELKVVGKDPLNKHLLDDYSNWFFNSR